MNACGMTNADGSAIINFAPIAKASWVGVPPFLIAKFDVTSILVMAPIKLNSENFFKTISQYLNIKTDDALLKILLRSIKNFILDNKTKFLEKILPYFSENLLGLINHSTKEIKEEAVYCCVEIIMVVGYKFDKYLELLPKNQQNLINFFIKKRTG